MPELSSEELQVLLVALFEYRQHSEDLVTQLTLGNNYVDGVQRRIEVCKQLEAKLDIINKEGNDEL